MAQKIKDELEELFIEEDESVNRKTLRDILVRYIQLTKDGGIFFLPTFSKLNVKQKILVYLLAKKAINIKLGKEELTSPKEIQEATGHPKGTINPTLIELVKERLLKNVEGKYKVPNYSIETIKERFFGNLKEEKKSGRG
jgi:hypothetical protein